MNIEIRDTAVTEDQYGQKFIQIKKSTTVISYKVTVDIVGGDIPFVKSVTYILHKTFKNNIKQVKRSLANPNCKLSFYAWGTFTIYAHIETLNGETIRLSHLLRFDNDISNGNYKLSEKA